MSPRHKNVYVIKVQDRTSGEKLDFEITARSVHEAESKAYDAGWLVLDPSSPPPAPSQSDNEAKARELAVKIGVLKALGIAALVIAGLFVIGNIIVFLISEANAV